jgi:hypothetical protein
MKESATDPQSFSIGLQRNLRTKKKPGANEHTKRMRSVKAAWRRTTRSV